MHSSDASYDKTDRKRGDGWDVAENITRILSLLALPVIIAIIGGSIQSSLARRTVSQQYVQLAVSILTSKEAHEDLRRWAVDLLNDNSPTKLSPNVQEQLSTGAVKLPSQPSPLDRANFRLAQRYLKRLGYYWGEETGDYDNPLNEAITQFQKENNLEVDGYPGGQTIRKMLEVYEKKAGFPTP